MVEGPLNGAELLLGAHALARHGARPALLCGEEAVSYAELAARVQSASAAVRRLGVAPGDPVLLLMRDTPQFVAAWLGIVRAGAVAIALNNRLPEADYRHILDDSGARLVLVEDVFAAARPDLSASLVEERRIAIAGNCPAGFPSWDEQCAVGNAEEKAFDAGERSPAFALYSSGTTGRPKGILHAHLAFRHVGAAFRTLGVGEGERVFSTSKFFFAYGLEHGLLAPLAAGATAVLFPDWADADAVIGLVERHRPSALFGVPTLYRRLLAEPANRLAPLASVRRFVAAGERLTPQLVAQWKDATGGAELLNLYGMSETFCACMMTAPGESDGERTGKPFPGVELRLASRDGQGGAPDTGVLWVRHPAQALGYLNRPEETNEQFHDGWFCSRDVFHRDAAGFFVHQGRSDELLKVAGQWVQPGELEEVAGREASVGEAACVPVEDADGMLRLALFVTAKKEARAAERDAAAACERALPRYKRPKWVRAVRELPRTATGKVQRYKLREILERELRPAS